ncbi:hypothetical protein [Candidatus Berkiella aquae]|uniref:T2SS substrate NttA domain-containing protein n=1 Tax=Candidatus Berkiella aquae TaxID=295108 RepID=A0A0Q9YTI4_9GAMM|nr:hypothetical protein [Candidatus Berkiella aquae]MCS5710020.1 hypothetical protein [Candidatus Berkiella aquae]
MQIIAIILTFMIGSFLEFAWAGEPILGPVKAPAASASSTNNLVNKKAWIENMQNNLPSLLCKKDQHFMTCFKITENECVDLNKLFVQACLNNVSLALPAELNSDEATRWGSVIGQCTFDLYEKFMQSKKVSKPECNQQAKTKP